VAVPPPSRCPFFDILTTPAAGVRHKLWRRWETARSQDAYPTAPADAGHDFYSLCFPTSRPGSRLGSRVRPQENPMKSMGFTGSRIKKGGVPLTDLRPPPSDLRTLGPVDPARPP
jgi:hypothetical protein